MEIQLFDKNTIQTSDIKAIATDLANKLDTGEVSALLLQLKFKALEKVQEAIKETLRDIAVREVKKYPEKQVALYGATFEAAEFGHKWDFEATGDPIWMRLNAKLLAAKEALKARENFLKSIRDHETVVDEDSGEIVKVTRPVQTSTTAVKCTL
jgi:hypothetical protein